MFPCFNINCIISALTDGSTKTASMSLLCEYCAHFKIQLKECEGYRKGGAMFVLGKAHKLTIIFRIQLAAFEGEAGMFGGGCFWMV